MIPGHVQRALAADPSAHICRHTPDKGAYICASTRPDKCGYMDFPPRERKERLGLGSHVGSTHATQANQGRHPPRRQRRMPRTFITICALTRWHFGDLGTRRALP